MSLLSVSRTISVRSVLPAMIVLIVAASHPPVFAQEPVGVMDRRPPSPTAASLGKFGEMPVSAFTGTPDVTIPLATVRGATLELPVALRYHASGIRVADVPSWVGAGWSLDAGGVITRVVRGLPDDAPKGYFETGGEITDPVWTQAHFTDAGYIDGTSSELVHYLQQIDNRNVDPEPDLYYYNMMGYSGQFAVTHTGEIITIPKSAMKITRGASVEVPVNQLTPGDTYDDQSIRTWTITAPDGTRFTFGDPYQGVEYSIRVSSHSSAVSAPVTACTANCTWASAWYLTRIEAPGGDAIVLEYADPDIAAGDWRVPPSQRFRIQYLYAVGNGSGCGLEGGGLKSPSWSADSVYVGTPRLTKITGLRHSITIESVSRHDGFFAPGEYYVDAIHEWEHDEDDQPNLVRSFDLRYYDPAEELAFGGRLMLREVQEIGADGLEHGPYRLTYDTESGSLPGDPLSYSVDHWGYFNGAGNTLGLPAVRIWNMWSQEFEFWPGDDYSSTPAMSAGSLQRIDYPTGGFTVLRLEPHRYQVGDWVEQSAVTLGVTTAEAGPGPEPVTESVEFSVGTGQRIHYTLTAAFLPAPIDIDGGPTEWPDCDGPCARAWIVDENNDVVASAAVTNSTNGFVKNIAVVGAGTYTFHAEVRKYIGYEADPNDRAGEYVAGGNVSILNHEYVEKMAGGLRVSTIEHYDGDDTLISQTEFLYYDGVLKREPVYKYIGFDYGGVFMNCSWAYRQSTPVYPLGSISGSSVAYHRVEERRVAGSGANGHGKTIRWFNVTPLQPSPYALSTALWAFSAETNYDYLFGYEIRTEHRNEDDEPIIVIERVQGREGEDVAQYARAIAARIVHRQHYNMHDLPIMNVPYSHFQHYKVIGEWLFDEREKIMQLGLP